MPDVAGAPSQDADASGLGDTLVTVSLVTFEGLGWLSGCLDSVAAQDGVDHEVLILDNASTDGSAAWLRERAAGDPRMELYESPVNLGFAAGHDRNLARARGEFVLLLNQEPSSTPASSAWPLPPSARTTGSGQSRAASAGLLRPVDTSTRSTRPAW